MVRCLQGMFLPRQQLNGRQIRSDSEGDAEEEKEVEAGREVWGCDQRPARAPCAYFQPYKLVIGQGFISAKAKSTNRVTKSG